MNIRKTLKRKKEKKHNKKRKKQKSPSQTLRDMFFSQRFVGWKLCISVFCCSSSCYVFVYVSFCFVCFRLVFLSFCIYNRKNTHKIINTKKKKKRKTQRKTYKKKENKNEKTKISQSDPQRYLFAVGSRAGYPVFMLLLFVFEFFIFRLVFLSFLGKVGKMMPNDSLP